MIKTILKTALITFLSIVLVLGATFGGLVLFAPKFVAEKSENLGLNNLAIAMYERDYKKNTSVKTLYTLVDKGATFGYDNVVVKYGAKLFENENYFEYISAIDEANFDENEKVLVNLKLSNADNRLKTKYVKSLAKTDFDSAFDYARLDLKESDMTKEYINFIMAGLVNSITSDNSSKFNESIDGVATSSLIKTKFDELHTVYEGYKASSSNYQNAVRSSKCIDMIQFMLYLEDKTECGYNETELKATLQTLFSEYKTYIA